MPKQWQSRRGMAPGGIPPVPGPFFAVTKTSTPESYGVAAGDPADKTHPAMNLPEAIGRSVANELRCGVQLDARLPLHQMPSAHASHFQEITAPPSVNVTDAAYVDVVSFLMPEQQIGVVKYLGLELESAAAFNDVRWRLVYGDNQPFEGWNDLRAQIGSILHPAEVTIQLAPKRFIKLQAISLTAGVPHYARGRLSGWRAPTVRFEGTATPRSWLGD